MASVKVSYAFIMFSAVNAVPPDIAKRWHSSICLKMSAIGRCEAIGVVRRVVFTCNAAGIMRRMIDVSGEIYLEVILIKIPI